jgi:hypothetical protein
MRTMRDYISSSCKRAPLRSAGRSRRPSAGSAWLGLSYRRINAEMASRGKYQPEAFAGWHGAVLTGRPGAMFGFNTPDGAKVVVDPAEVAYIECRGEYSRIVFSGGFDLWVTDEVGANVAMIKGYKEWEQE